MWNWSTASCLCWIHDFILTAANEEYLQRHGQDLPFSLACRILLTLWRLEQGHPETVDAQQRVWVVSPLTFWMEIKHIWFCHPGLLLCPSYCYCRYPTIARRALINMSLLCRPELTTSHFPLTATQITCSCCFHSEKHGFWKAYSLSGC